MTAGLLGCCSGVYLDVATSSLAQLSAGSKETIPFWPRDLGSSLGMAKARSAGHLCVLRKGENSNTKIDNSCHLFITRCVATCTEV